MPFNLVLVSQGVCALGLPKGKIQYMADLAQNGAETGLDWLRDFGKSLPFLPILGPSIPPPPSGGLKGRLEGHLLTYKRTQFSGSLFSNEILVQVPHLASVVGWAYNGSLHSSPLLS